MSHPMRRGCQWLPTIHGDFRRNGDRLPAAGPARHRCHYLMSGVAGRYGRRISRASRFLPPSILAISRSVIMMRHLYIMM